MHADMVLIEANAITMDPLQPNAKAIAIIDDKIVKVGTNEEINSLINKNTKIINLQGKTVIPGLIDSHLHVADFGKVLTWIDLNDVNSIEEMKKRIRKRAQQIPKGRWIRRHLHPTICGCGDRRKNSHCNSIHGGRTLIL